jgi:hypothetical protein
MISIQLPNINGKTIKLPKKVTMQLVGLDGNAFSILGRFSRAAREEGWSEEEIKRVIDEAMSSDYSHLLATISKNVIEPNEPEDWSEDDDEEEDFDDDDEE